MRGIADTIFGPLINVLNTVLGYLSSVTVTLSSGLDIGNYLGYVGAMGSAWVFLIKSFILCLMLVTTMKVGKMGYSMYLQLKSGVKWW